jgi:hypothetical protein
MAVAFSGPAPAGGRYTTARKVPDRVFEAIRAFAAASYDSAYGISRKKESAGDSVPGAVPGSTMVPARRKTRAEGSARSTTRMHLAL